MAMFLKRDPKNRSIISRFLAALIRPFMSERPSQLPQLFFHSPDGHIQESVVQWNTHMSQYLDADGDNTYARCFLDHIEHRKCSQRVGHELLVLYFTHWDNNSSALGVVCVDRVVNHDVNSVRQSGLVCPSSSNNMVAHDIATIVGSPQDAAAYLRVSQQRRSSNVLCEMQFPPSSRPSALQVSTILALVNQHSLFYSLYQRQCYWYADTVWRSLKRLFSGSEQLHTGHNSRARYAGIQLGPSDESVNVVCERYELAWTQTLEELNQARNLREAQLARIREEGRAASEPVMRAQQCQIEEQRRQIEEQRRQIEELRLEQQRQEQCQIEEQRRQIEELRSEQQRQEQELRAEIERLRARAAATDHGIL
ncbi:hypothetical protein M405DRAFT_931057 [Rhizopogon salebrosus TDB-379]|nr:hypothetical protein M405DRAFT_931057 [Rhizopogon salebrosus TDB-379]